MTLKASTHGALYIRVLTYSMPNDTIYKSSTCIIHFALALTVSDISAFEMFDLEKVGQGQ